MKKLPIGTRIFFVKDLFCEASGDHPAMFFAQQGESGEITGYNNFEGYMVKRDSWPTSFGASRNEFEIK